LTQDSLHAKQGPRVTAISIGGSVAVLITLRMAAVGSTSSDPLDVEGLSMMFLVGLGAVTWAYIAIGIIVAGARWGRVRRQQ
jgi:hypothetical protein